MWQGDRVRHRAAQGTYGRTAAGVAAWFLGAACAVAVGALALSLIGSGLGDRSRPPLAAQVLPAPSRSIDSAAATPSAAASPSAKRSPNGVFHPPLSPSASATPVQRDFTFDVGSVTARCDGDSAYLISWSPAQGYRVDDVRRGPAPSVRVELESFTVEASIFVRCVDGIPRASVSHEPRR